MGVIIGMDEAGLGPNLGPFVVAATVWEFPGRSTRCDLFEKLADVVSPIPTDDGRLHVADSKQIFSTARGLEALEHAALVLLNLADCGHTQFPELLLDLCDGVEMDDWMTCNGPIDLPTEADRDGIASSVERLRSAMRSARIRCRAIRVSLVFPSQFNRWIAETDNKAETCSQLSLNLLRSVWNPEEETAYVIGDRHGGRARYDQLLSRTFNDMLVFRISESAELSRYRLGSSEVRVECRAERHFAVAAASLVAKYVRELSMRMFNSFWRQHVPDIRPTQGYPGDSHRFAEDVAAARVALGIPDHVFWRER
jgi:hypothetical protein